MTGLPNWRHRLVLSSSTLKDVSTTVLGPETQHSPALAYRCNREINLLWKPFCNSFFKKCSNSSLSWVSYSDCGLQLTVKQSISAGVRYTKQRPFMPFRKSPSQGENKKCLEVIHMYSYTHIHQENMYNLMISPAPALMNGIFSERSLLKEKRTFRHLNCQHFFFL